MKSPTFRNIEIAFYDCCIGGKSICALAGTLWILFRFHFTCLCWCHRKFRAPKSNTVLMFANNNNRLIAGHTIYSVASSEIWTPTENRRFVNFHKLFLEKMTFYFRNDALKYERLRVQTQFLTFFEYKYLRNGKTATWREVHVVVPEIYNFSSSRTCRTPTVSQIFVIERNQNWVFILSLSLCWSVIDEPRMVMNFITTSNLHYSNKSKHIIVNVCNRRPCG